MSVASRSALALALFTVLFAGTGFAQVVPSTVIDLGPSCGNPSPHLAVTGVTPGGTVLVCLDTAFPGNPATMEGHVMIFISLPVAAPNIYPTSPLLEQLYGECRGYIAGDLTHPVPFMVGNTDAQGDWCGSFPVLSNPSLVGTVLNLQARVWAQGGPFEGGDHLSNGIQIRVGNTVVSGLGLTPGYWKQPQHFYRWAPQYTPSTLFSSVFDNAFPGKTLLQVLAQGGGGLNALGRHVVAALLNASATNTNFPLTTTQVITLFNGAVPGPSGGIETLKNYLESLNQAGG